MTRADIVDWATEIYEDVGLGHLGRSLEQAPGHRAAGMLPVYVPRDGQLMILREVERRAGVPGAFIESDLVDPRYFSAANIKNRLESYFQMLDAREPGVGMSAAIGAAAAGTVRCVVGVDLGSTTSKAVVMDREGRVLGRGITNSRSSYDRAVEVARVEAFVAARFQVLRRNVEQAAGPEARLLRAFRVEQRLVQLDRLRLALEHEIARSVPAPTRDAVAAAVSAIVSRMRAEEEDSFDDPSPGARSDFFRDAAGSAFARLAETAAAAGPGVSFDLLLGLFDKCIIQVENAPLELGFVEHIRSALARCGADDALRRGVEASVATRFELDATVGTGYGRARLPFAREQIRSEILCHGLGAHAMFPGTRTVLDIGGQDTKAIQVDDQGIVTSFQMNDRCAAGCGRYLGYIADEMNLGLHELGPLAEQGRRPVKINSTCTVFAGAESCASGCPSATGARTSWRGSTAPSCCGP